MEQAKTTVKSSASGSPLRVSRWNFRVQNARIVVKPGCRFGLLIVEEIAAYHGDQVIWLCRCNCGKQITANSTQLKRGEVTSCGSRLCRYKAVKAMMEKHSES